MSQQAEYKPLSLTQHFEAPDGFTGRFAWVCGYSADSGFLNDAVERFSGKTTAQRAYEGTVSVALMLDTGNEQITPIEVPALLHLPVKSPAELPFKLLHSKVAILGFRHESDPKQWRLKLIVSTGNWTRSTLEESLDLVWCAEFGSENLNVLDEAKEQDAADIAAAWESIQWLQRFFDSRALHPRLKDPTKIDLIDPTQEVQQWLKRTTAFGKKRLSRFLDNRKAGLLDQMPEKITHCSSPSARNYLAMGSGFYEATVKAGHVPSVLKRIVDRLSGEGLLTKSADIEVYVNSNACQAVALALKAIDDAGWAVLNAVQPSYFPDAIPRSLHAKFIFGCSHRTNSNYCSNAWLYLGSGNLTQPGFTKAIHPNYGNFEAGVVFSPDGLQWEDYEDTPQELLLSNRLPVDTSDEYTAPESLPCGADMPQRKLVFAAAPIAYLYWDDDARGGWLTTNVCSDEQSHFELLDVSGTPCDFIHERGFSWQGERPRQVEIRWELDGISTTTWVPVIDKYGRLAATVLPRIDIEQAWEQLENFPMPPDDEDLANSGLTDDDDEPTEAGVSRESVEVRYPIRQMMQLIENISSKQVSVQRLDWALWCRRFEQCLTQASESPVVAEFAKLNLNPLSPLKHKPFRPKFAEDDKTKEGVLFDMALYRVQLAWDVSKLADIGGEV